MSVKDFRELKVWERAHQMTLLAYKLTDRFPKHELFGLASQIRRCSSSIPANIAEGCGRVGNSEFHRFLQNRVWVCEWTWISFPSCQGPWFPGGARLFGGPETAVGLKTHARRIDSKSGFWAVAAV